MLAFYGRVFRTIEVDATFYGVPAEPVVRSWREQVPRDFQFSLKVPQQITHEQRLVGVDSTLGRFVERASVLGDALGPLLLQMSPDFHATPDNRTALRAFLPTLPRDVRWAMEFRTSAWISDDVMDVLGNHGVALVLADSRWHRRERVLQLAQQPTADFSYVRWMGAERRFTDYSKAQCDCGEVIQNWADALRDLSSRVDVVYGYFNNQFQGHSPHSVAELQRALGIAPVKPSDLHPQGDLFGGAKSEERRANESP